MIRRLHSWSRKFLLGAFALWLIAPASAAATVLAVRRASVDTVVADGLTLALTRDPTTEMVDAHLKIERLSETRTGITFERLDWHCELRALESGWHCAGPLVASQDGVRLTGRLDLQAPATGLAVSLSKGNGRATVTVDDAVDATAQLRLERVPMAWLAGVIRMVLPSLTRSAGELDSTLVVDRNGVRGDWGVSGVGLDTTDGAVASAELTAKGSVDVHSAEVVVVKLQAQLLSGEWLIAPVYVNLGAQPVALAVEASAQADGGWRVSSWRIDDPEALQAQGSASISAASAVEQLTVDSLHAEFPAAYDRYAKAALAPLGLGDLSATGSVDGELRWSAAGLGGSVRPHDIGVIDQGQRFSIEGLGGRAFFGPDNTQDSELAWTAARVYRIPLGASSLQFRAGNGGWRLLQPLELALLEGRLRLTQLQRAALENADREWHGALELDGISMKALAQALDWPAFGGSLSGSIPALHGDAERIVLDGGLSLSVFDGKVAIDDLSIERPLGVAPTIAASIGIEDIDLKLLTDAFSFGTIEGRMDGQIADLRMVDWSPVAFDAKFRTDSSAKDRRRLSQRAVNNLSSVGGGGAAGIQQGLLKLFDSFPYAEIGLGCRLANNVCTMDGLDSAGQGYTIVRGSGLPYLTVQGFQRRVDWPVLVARLKAATAGQAPIIGP